jgi:hypothetical protein
MQILTLLVQSIGWYYCYTSRSRIFHLYGDVNIAGEGLQNLGLLSALNAFDQVYLATPAMTWGLGFPVSPEGPTYVVAFYDTQGDVEDGSILTQILTGYHSIASYDTQGGVEDLFLPWSSRVYWMGCWQKSLTPTL